MKLSVDEVQRMKVAELKVELSSRGLDSRGVKAILVDRLLDAIAVEVSPNDSNGKIMSQISTGAESTPQNMEITEEAMPETNFVDDLTKKRSSSRSPTKLLSPTPSSPTKDLKSPPKSPSKAPENVEKIEEGEGKIGEVGSTVSEIAEPSQSEPSQLNNKSLNPPETNSDEMECIGSSENDCENNTKILESSDVVTSSCTEEVVAFPTAETEEAMETGEGSENLKRKLEEEGKTSPQKKGRIEESFKSRILPDDEPEYDDTKVLLDWYKSDLNLLISKDGFLKAEQIVFDEFPWAYAGVKATHGFKKGKLAYEVKWIEDQSVKIDFGTVESKNVLRIGWSDLYTDFQLGEEPFSYGYDSEGKFYSPNEVIELEDQNFIKGDVITAYLDLESDPIEMSFAKNGTLLESSIKIPACDVEGKTWFPHILSRNVQFEANFGSLDPSFPIQDSFEFVDKVESSELTKIQAPKVPPSKSDCEFIMLCGMACSGKTKWAKDFKLNNLDKHYNILGTSTVVERAVKSGTLQTPDIPKSYESFLMKAGRFVEKLVDMAPARRRNYILDQSNILPVIQRRKAAGFEGFNRRAVVILPSEENYEERVKAYESEQKKPLPVSTLLEMKATFKLPEAGPIFSTVEFPELDKEAAEALVQKYNKEGRDAGYGQKSFRGGSNYRGRNFKPNFRGMRGGPFRGGPPMRWMGGGRPWGGRGGLSRGGGREMGRGGYGGPPPLMRGGRGGGGIPPLLRGRGGGGGGGAPWSRGGARGGGPRGASPYSSPSPRGGTSYSGRGFGGRGGAQIRPQQPQVWNNGTPGAGNNSSGWGRGTSPWTQVPDQGYGQSWDNSRRGNRGGGGTWQGYGGKTYGGYGRK